MKNDGGHLTQRYSSVTEDLPDTFTLNITESLKLGPRTTWLPMGLPATG
ncbi:hypothetical protein [Arthrobacter antibioticus]|nr:hypothetical protein [Arthrobacter sp. H35-MC1]MDJ0316039.1 hypothetical protein [Arthrobacter sp. H35-MC1]